MTLISEITKLSLQTNDILVVKSEKVLTQMELLSLTKTLSTLMEKSKLQNAVWIVDPEIKLEVMTKEELLGDPHA